MPIKALIVEPAIDGTAAGQSGACLPNNGRETIEKAVEDFVATLVH